MADIKCTFIPGKLFEHDHGEVIRSKIEVGETRRAYTSFVLSLVLASVSLLSDGLLWEEVVVVEDDEEDEDDLVVPG